MIPHMDLLLNKAICDRFHKTENGLLAIELHTIISFLRDLVKDNCAPQLKTKSLLL